LAVGKREAEKTVYAIETEKLSKVYKRQFWARSVTALESLDLKIAENEIFGFLGKNGAGKTTAIKILCGLLRSSSGIARIHGVDVRKREAREFLGYLPENPYFYEYLSPRETIDFYGRLDGMTAKARRWEWDRLSEALDLREIGDQRVRGFSKGMRQRLGFAVALVGDPEVLVLDEPMSGLDPMGRRMIRDLILQARDSGKTVFFSSHVLSDVEQISDRIGMLVDGRLRSAGSIDELLTRRVNVIEVIARNIPDFVIQEIKQTAVKSRETEQGIHFSFTDLEVANDTARKIHAFDGTLVEFTPVKETLEDYFIREQETAGIES